MDGKDYLNTKSYLEQKALDLANAVSHIDEQLDDMYKINLYLLRRYKDDLLKEFQLENDELPQEWVDMLSKVFNTTYDPKNESIQLMRITNKIKEKMKEEMPYPWYCYGFGGSENAFMA